MVLAGYVRRIHGDVTPRMVFDPATARFDPAEIAAGCLISLDPGFADRAREGDLLVLDGRLRDDEGIEDAVLALQACGITAVICRGADPEFVDVAGMLGLAVLCAPAAVAALAEGDLVRLDLETGSIERRRDRAAWQAPALPASVVATLRRVQVLARMRRVVDDEGYADG